MSSVGLTSGALVNLLFSYWSLGCSVWSAIPQIFLTFWDGKKHGYIKAGAPSWVLLWLWLVGDVGQLAGMWIEKVPLVQRMQGLWFGISDLIIMLERAYYLGLVPGSSPQKIIQARRMRITMPNQQGHEDQNEVPQKHPQEEERKWRNFDGWRLNGVIAAAILVICFCVWLPLDFLRRDTADALHPAEAPFADGKSGFGWYIAWAGLFFYQVPRPWQLWRIHKKGASGLSLFLFLYYIGQNVTSLVSIVALSHTSEALYDQAPFIANGGTALIFDTMIVIAIIRFKRRQSKTRQTAAALAPPVDISPPSQAGITERNERWSTASGVSRPSTAVRRSASHATSHNGPSRRPSTRSGGRSRSGTRSAGGHPHSRERSSSPSGSSELDEQADFERRAQDAEELQAWQKWQAWAKRPHSRRASIDSARSSSPERSSDEEARHPLHGGERSESAHRGSSGEMRAVGKRVFHPRRGVGTRY
ncbi:hypothetical protein JCM10207_003532 [Rhodosporidiobolus poonsookiae]